MSEDQKSSDGQHQEDVWLHMAHLKMLAKVLKNVALVLHCTALDRLCRTAGFTDYPDALHHPRALGITFDDWCERLAQEFGMPLDEILSDEESGEWFARLFVQRGRTAALERGHSTEYPQRRPEALEEDLEDQSISNLANHERTVVDSIRRRER
ncbi:hypothetical protein WKW77_24500 [Variovorax ureilyticus]|uniref:Uncharacterized protein n=1 Tax=Variovorax ureilyticus TaxID=1836198 RepID=A0ABU8VKU5_9BURK